MPSKTAEPAKFKIATLYGGEIEVKFSEGNHRYYINGKPAEASVTGILGILDKAALLPWAVREAINKAIRLLVIGEPVTEQLKAAIELLGKAEPNRQRDEAADEGTRCHAAHEEWILRGIAQGNGKFTVNKQGLADLEVTFRDWPEPLQMAMQQYARFLEDQKAIFLAAEKILYSKKYGVPGMMDAELVLKGNLGLGDVKIRSGVYEETRLQTAWYQIMAEEESGLKYRERTVLWFGRKDLEGNGTRVFTGDFAAIKYDNFRGDAKAAVDAYNLFKWKKDARKKA